MMKRTTHLFYSSMILLLAACQPVHHQQPEPGTAAADTIQAHISGNWYNDDDIYGCMTLTLDSNGRFAFYEAGCTVNRYSAGTLQREGNHLHFTSDPQFKTNAAQQSMYDTAALRQLAAANTFPGPGDTLNIYLGNEHYLLEKDTLYKLDREGNKTDMRFHR